MSLLKETREFYKKRKLEEKQKKQLINAKTNFNLLESLIAKCNENPQLKIAVYIADGTRLELTTYEPKTKRDYENITGDYYEIK